MSVYEPSVSIIINTIDRADLLADALRGIQSLDWPHFEVIVVNGPSSDHTADVLRQWAGRIKIGHCGEANLAKSRNVGLALASGEIVAFLDDDAIPHPAWLRKLVAPYVDPAVGAVGGHTIGRMGSTYQARTTLCDRYGDPYFVSSHVDLSVFCQPGSWVYPAMLGTNASVRRSAIAGIGGFDDTFAYYLDETDICLRLVDAGWQIRYAPDALIWHQFASSALRSGNMTRRSVRAIVRSHSYFINRHGTRPWSTEIAREAADRLTILRQHWLGGNLAAAEEGAIDSRHRAHLDREVDEALQQGFHDAQTNSGRNAGAWAADAEPPPFLPLVRNPNAALTVAFVCRHFLRPEESGIPRWTGLLARELADRGHNIHVICEAGEPETRIRYSRGIWTHEIPSDSQNFGWVEERFGLPAEQAQWAASVQRHAAVVRSFGLDLLSFPIWELEGIACTDEPGLPICMSLHTTYGLSLRFRPDWQMQPLFRDALANRMIAAENQALKTIPHLLANSRSILAELGAQCGSTLDARARIAVHGTKIGPAAHDLTIKSGNLLVFAGRFEKRKGFDIALDACIDTLGANEEALAVFVGGTLAEADVPPQLQTRMQPFLSSGRLQFRGVVGRAELNELLSRADIAVLPSRYESFGLVAIEAMAAGCVVLAVDAGAVPEIVTAGRNGILVKPDANVADSLGRAAIELLGDADRLKAMQAAASQTARDDFSVSVMAHQVEAAFRHFVGAERGEALAD